MKSASSVKWVICPGGATGAFNSVLKGWFGFQIYQQVFCTSIYQFNFKLIYTCAKQHYSKQHWLAGSGQGLLFSFMQFMFFKILSGFQNNFSQCNQTDKMF